jgi:hypothetical protein
MEQAQLTKEKMGENSHNKPHADHLPKKKKLLTT